MEYYEKNEYGDGNCVACGKPCFISFLSTMSLHERCYDEVVRYED